MEALNTAPQSADFIPLSTHQSETPESFYNGPPVLYHRSQGCTLKISQHDLTLAPALARLAGGDHEFQSNGLGNGNGARKDSEAHEGDEEEDFEVEVGPEVAIENVDVWISSE